MAMARKTGNQDRRHFLYIIPWAHIWQTHVKALNHFFNFDLSAFANIQTTTHTHTNGQIRMTISLTPDAFLPLQTFSPQTYSLLKGVWVKTDQIKHTLIYAA